MVTTSQTVSEAIKEKLSHGFEPVFLDIVDESANHCGHAFTITIVSNKFAGMSLIERHRMVNEVIRDHMEANGGTVHAIHIKAKTPEQWQKQ